MYERFVQAYCERKNPRGEQKNRMKVSNVINNIEKKYTHHEKYKR